MITDDTLHDLPLGRRVAILRANANITQNQLAHSLEVCSQSISRAENKNRISGDLAIRLARFFKRPVDVFYE